MSLHLLEELGFEHAATWSLDQDLLSITYHNHQDTSGLLYAFVSNQIVRYVGVTERTFLNRMYGYRMPGRGQATNIRVNSQITQLLLEGASVRVYCLSGTEEVSYRGIRINLPAGIENPLICRIAQFHIDNGIPQLWNIRGNRRTVPALVTQEAVEEAVAEDMIYVEAIPEEIQTVHVYSEFYVKLRNAYYYKPFFNLRIAGSHLLGVHGEEITVDCIGLSPCQIVRTINRTHNTNGTVRLNLNQFYTEWVQANYRLDDMMTVRILNRNHIQLL